MKQILSVILIISLSSALADQTAELGSRNIHGTGPLEIWPTIYSQTYSYENLLNGYSNYSAGNRWVCDDFEVTGFSYVFDIWVWMIWTGEQGTEMNLVFSVDDAGDSDPNTNTDLMAESFPCTNTFTGDSNWGYDIYEIYIDIYEGPFFELIPGTHYYFEVQADTWDNCFILVSHNYNGDYCWYNDGSGVWVRSDIMFGEDSDMFFNFVGQILTLESETWGSIKTLF
ncbi:MAG: hypothetical protein KAW14_06735 [Candidatus Aegiribacteria sp.]|nr:hypothetical protein [Candidatus Aegiribacteria sp.]